MRDHKKFLNILKQNIVLFRFEPPFTKQNFIWFSFRAPLVDFGKPLQV